MSLVKFYNLTGGSYDSQWDDGILLDSPDYAYIFGTQFSSKAKVDSDIQTVREEIAAIDTSNLAKLDELLTRNQTADIGTLTSVPINYAYLVCDINSNQTLSFSQSSDWGDGKSVHIFVYNSGTSEVTITIPNTGNYVNMSSETLTIPANGGGEIDAFSDGYNIWLRHASSELTIDPDTYLGDGEHQLG